MRYQVGDIFVKKASDSAAAIIMEDIGTIVQIEACGQHGKLLDIKIQWSSTTNCYSYSEGDLDNNFAKYYTHYPVKQ